MNILQLSPQTPFPLNAGAKVGIYGTTKSLRNLGHEITFLTYRKEVDKKQALPKLSEICEPILLEYMANNTLFGAFINMFSGIPYNIWKYKTKLMADEIKKVLRSKSIDIVHIDHLHMAWAIDVVKREANIPVVLRQHNLEMKIMKRFCENENSIILKKYSELQYSKFIKYEPKECQKFDKVIMITKNDEDELLSLNKKINTCVIPVGVEAKMLDKKMPIEKIPFSIFHIGPMDWFPNYDGLRWYLDEVFPIIVNQIKDVKLFLYSKGVEKLNISDNIKNNVIVVGNVDDLWKHVEDKQLAIVPLRIGSGMRTKIIEMMGYGQNILSTSIGHEGIEVTNEKNILTADTPEDFAKKTIDYFYNKYDHSKLSENAKDLVRQKYTWEIIGRQFENVYQSVIGK